MKVFLTGCTGFLGSHLVHQLSERGHAVAGCAVDADEGTPGFVRHSLGSRLDPSHLRGVNVFLHGAYDPAAGYATNHDGTIQLYEAARGESVGRQVFISSYSARPDAPSEYGRLKYALEQFFLERGETVVRPGLVIGNGGLFGRNMRKILASPVMPLLDGGRDRLPLIGIRDFTAAMVVILEKDRTGAFNLFYPDLVTMRTLIQTVNDAGRHRAVCVYIPVGVAEAALSVLERIGVRLPVDRGNLRALKANQQPIHESDLDGLLAQHSTGPAVIREAVAELLAERARSV